MEMHNIRITVDIQVDSEETTILLAKIFAYAMMKVAEKTVDYSENDDVRVRLGETTIKTVKSFRPNGG